MVRRRIALLVLSILLSFSLVNVQAQCGGILEPGFAFLTSSRGCAPFTVNIQTLYLSSVPGTQYFVDWGDGTPEETFMQVAAGGVNISHLYPNTSIDCGYDVTIDASNACNPRGSVVPIQTQVIVWTNDVVSINPAVFRVCQGFATNVLFTDDSQWNCFPRATRENNEPRWIQWLYGTGTLVNQIPGARVNGILPGGFPYLDPAPARNPIYPVVTPGQVSLPINVPVTLPADIGKEFEITLKNWNQCNPYDNFLLDLNPFNPVGGDLVNGDNPAQVVAARIVIVDAPQPTYATRLGGPGGPLQTTFCIGDDIYFDNNTPAIGGASFQDTWEFYDNNTGLGVPIATSTSTNPTFAYVTAGQKLIRLSVRDQNAAGNCVAIFESLITISPSLVAQIQVTDLANAPITPFFCQNASAPLVIFQARFNDVSVGVVTPTTLWRWEFYDENNVVIRNEPLGGGFSAIPLGPFDQSYSTPGIYRARLIIRDNITSCETVDEVQIRVYERPVPVFVANKVCEGQLTSFTETSTLNPINGEVINLREWDFNYDGVTFTKDPAFDNQSTFTRSLGAAGTYQVALRVTTDQNTCTDLLVIPVTVDPLPNASFTPDVISGCSILTVTFNNTSIPGQPDIIDRYSWEVDEKQGLGFIPVAVQQPTDPGFSNLFVRDFENLTMVNKLVDVRLRVATVNNCERISPVVTLTIFPGTQSGFTAINYSPFNDNCSPQIVDFSVDAQTQSLTPTDYRWRISDASGILSETSTGTTPSFSSSFVNTTQSVKDFFVTLITTLPTGCFGSSTRTIRISPVPVSDFMTEIISTDCNAVSIKMTAQQKGLPAYHWVIKENGITVSDATGTNDVMIYNFNRPAFNTADLSVQISLDTKNFANCVSPVSTQSIIIPKKENSNASFTVSPKTQSLPGSTVTITNTTTPGPWLYTWDLGDGTISNSPDPSIQHTYATYGSYTITLTVANGVCVETQSETVFIQAIPPIVDFDYAPPSGCVPLTVKFTNLSKFAEPDKYVWEFGDGQATSRAVDPSYTYFEAGKYTVTLSASNITGQTVKVTKQMIIEVFPKPDADFEVKPKLVYIPGGILYTSNRSFGATSFEWDFGDGGTSTSPEPEHRYKNEGEFDITLIAKNEFGCADTVKTRSAARVEKGGQVLVPNAFSPNVSSIGSGGSSNGKNDVFLPLTRGVVEFELLVFNRWGELLFESQDTERGWDGYYNGKLCPQDVYMYKLTALYENGERVVRVGDINLIR